MKKMIICAASLVPCLAWAGLSEGVLSYRWGQKPAAELRTKRVEIDGRQALISCTEQREGLEDLLEGSVSAVELCYHQDELFQVKLKLSSQRVQLFEEVLREKYGQPALEARGGRQRMSSEAGLRPRGARSESRGSPGMSWETDESRIVLDGWSLVYRDRAAAARILEDLESRDERIRKSLRAEL